MAKQLTVAEAHKAVEAKTPNRTVDELRILAASVVKAREDADKAEPALDVVEQGAKHVIAVAREEATQGRYAATIIMSDANYQTAYRICQQLREAHGFTARQSTVNNKQHIEVTWLP